MVTLAFDTSTSKGGVAIVTDQQVIASITWEREGSHGELLTPAIEQALGKAGLQATQIDRLAIGHGPGSFTGVRITVNAARSLAYALGIPVRVFDTAEILAAGSVRRDLPLAVLINAHKNLAYTALFRFDQSRGRENWTRTHELSALTLDQLAKLITTPHLCLGDGYSALASGFSPALTANLVRDPAESDFPQPDVIARFANRSPDLGQTLAWNQVQALYIRSSGAEENLRETKKN